MGQLFNGAPARVDTHFEIRVMRRTIFPFINLCIRSFKWKEYIDRGKEKFRLRCVCKCKAGSVGIKIKLVHVFSTGGPPYECMHYLISQHLWWVKMSASLGHQKPLKNWMLLSDSSSTKTLFFNYALAFIIKLSLSQLPPACPQHERTKHTDERGALKSVEGFSISHSCSGNTGHCKSLIHRAVQMRTW